MSGVQEEELVKHSGGCHCGGITWSVLAPSSITGDRSDFSSTKIVSVLNSSRPLQLLSVSDETKPPLHCAETQIRSLDREILDYHLHLQHTCC